MFCLPNKKIVQLVRLKWRDRIQLMGNKPIDASKNVGKFLMLIVKGLKIDGIVLRGDIELQLTFQRSKLFRTNINSNCYTCNFSGNEPCVGF